MFKGPFYLRHGCVEGYIEITMSNGDVIRRSRKIRGAVIGDLYVLNGVRYTKFGREVPEDIQKALGVALIDFGDGLEMNLNFQPQHDSKFLLSRDYDGMDRTKVTTISGIKVIEQCMIQSSKIVRSVGTELTGEEKECVGLVEHVAGYGDLPDKIERIQTMKATYNNLFEKSKLVEWLKVNHQKILDFNNLKKPSYPIMEITDGLSKLGRLSLAKRLEQVLTEHAKTIRYPNDARFKDVHQKYGLAVKLMHAINKIEDFDWKAVDLQRKINVIVDEISKTNICPTCSRSLV